MVDQGIQAKLIDNNELVIEDSNMTIKYPEAVGHKLN